MTQLIKIALEVTKCDLQLIPAKGHPTYTQFFFLGHLQVSLQRDLIIHRGIERRAPCFYPDHPVCLLSAQFVAKFQSGRQVFLEA